MPCKKIGGFSLLECMIYLFGCCFLLMCCGSFCYKFQESLARLGKQETLWRSMILATHSFARDLKKNLSTQCVYIKKHPDQLAWSNFRGAHSWLFRDGRLMKREGQYDHLADRWHDQSTRAVIEGLSCGSLVYDTRDDELVGVWLMLELGGQRIQRYVGVRQISWYW